MVVSFFFCELPRRLLKPDFFQTMYGFNHFKQGFLLSFDDCNYISVISFRPSEFQVLTVRPRSNEVLTPSSASVLTPGAIGLGPGAPGLSLSPMTQAVELSGGQLVILELQK